MADEDQIDQEQAQERVAEGGSLSPEQMQQITDDIARRRANVAAGRDENDDGEAQHEVTNEETVQAVQDKAARDTEAAVLAAMPARATAEAVEPVINRMAAPTPAPEPPKALGERITDAATAFGDAVRNMTMADDSKHEKMTARDKAQVAVDNADLIVASSRTDGLGAADALVAVVNEWKVAVASRS